MVLPDYFGRVRDVLLEIPGVEDVKAVLKKSHAGSVVSSVNAVTLAVAVWGNLGSPYLLLWCLFALSISYASYYSTKRALTRKVSAVSARGTRKIVFFTFVGALPWGIITSAAIIHGGGYEQTITFSCAAGMTAGATFMLHRVTSACVSYAAGAVLPPVLTGLFVAYSAYWPIAVFAVMFVVYLTIAARKSGNTARERDRSVHSLSGALDEVKATKARMTHMVYVDHTTGMPNRTAFVERLAEEVANAEKNASWFAVFMLDLDRFKNVNDTLGHATGDLLLAVISSRLREVLAEEIFVARLGGDEFAVIIPDGPTDVDLDTTARSIIDKVCEVAQLEGRQVFPATSVGGARYPEDGVDAEEILKRADTALKRAKELGRGQFVLFSPELNQEMERTTWLESELRKAIDRDEIEVFYQPKVDIFAGRLAGVEALARWNHEDGRISPDVFFPVAADCGLLPQLTRSILARIADDMRAWDEDGVNVGRVAINVHPLDLKTPNELLANLRTLMEAGIDPRSVVLEVTEGCFVGRGTDSAPVVLDTINELGFELSLDDFGTGYASLSHLRKLPVAEIKIDKSFVAGICRNRPDRAIVAATVELARGMDLRVVAEGVETRDQLVQLRAFGVEVGQGYYWSRPVTAKELVSEARHGIYCGGQPVRNAAGGEDHHWSGLP